ncbi:MAG: DNRLRE domain-containing protein, partial [Sphingobacteriales bacterium]
FVVNAGPDQVIGLPEDSVVVNGSTSSNATVASQSWQTISGPGLPTVRNPNSSSTTISNLVAGTYLFEYSATTQDGRSDRDTMEVRVITGATSTLTVQSSGTSELIMVETTNNFSNTTTPELIAEAWTSSGAPFNIRSIVKFDLSSIPAGSTIVSAKLSLYTPTIPINGNLIDPVYGPTNQMYVERVLSAWSSGTLWQNQPATSSNNRVYVSHSTDPHDDLIDMDVTLMAREMLQNNYGFMIRLEDESLYNSRIYCSSNHTEIAKHPKLVVIYQ